VLALEMMSEAAGRAGAALRFEDEMHAYIAAYLDHIRTEEIEILPLAERVLTPPTGPSSTPPSCTTAIRSRIATATTRSGRCSSGS
jgi:hypothetical protein